MKVIRKIEPTLPILPERKKVAAYARVSEEKGRTFHSMSAQISHYSSYIQKIRNGSMQEFMQMKVLLEQQTKEVNFKE